MSEHHKSSSVFQLLDRKKFDALATKWGIDKGVRSFSTWELTQALLFCFVNRLHSYHEVECALGIPDSTFGDALRIRHFGFFQDLCDQVLLDIRASTADRKIKKAIRQILAIDSTDCRVHGSLFTQPSWRSSSKNRLASAKLHVVWNVEDQWVEDFRITGGARNDLTVAKTFDIRGGNVYVFDRAYVDLRFWLQIINAESHFVTRLKKAPRKEAVHKSVLNKEDYEKSGVLWDGSWTPSEGACYRNNIPTKTLKLRHVIYRDPLSGKIFDFISSDWSAKAQEIADIYKMRWSVELLFRWLKGHLNIRYFPARNKNAVKTQLTAAILLQLLLQLKKITQKYQGTLWELLRQTRMVSIQKGLYASGPPDHCRWNSAPRLSSELLNLGKQTG